MDDLEAKLADLRRELAATGGVMVAFSGGADSAFLLAAAGQALGGRAVAATGVSPSLAEAELADARALAAELGVRHLVVPTHEGDRPGYLRNGPDRCFFCKDELFEVLGPLAAAEGLALAVGTNTDDLGDHRPGQRAAAEHGVLTPLVTAGLSKAEIRGGATPGGSRPWRARPRPAWPPGSPTASRSPRPACPGSSGPRPCSAPSAWPSSACATTATWPVSRSPPRPWPAWSSPSAGNDWWPGCASSASPGSPSTWRASAPAR